MIGIAHLLRGDALLRVDLEHGPDQVLGAAGDLVPVAVVKVELALHDELKEHGIALVVERRVSAQAASQLKQHHNIHAMAYVINTMTPSDHTSTCLP